MNTFLSDVASHLYRTPDKDISSLTILFPSQRARLFFNDALGNLTKSPIWEPNYLTIDDIMIEASTLVPADRIRLIAELYRVYSKYHRNETFDKFYFWGDLLLSDFDMIDKYCVNASQLFRNIEDIKELESDVSYLTPKQLKQLEIISAFWESIGKEESLSEHKRRFLEIWRSLDTIYHEYRERLRKLGIGYTGMIHRDAVDRIADEKVEVSLPERKYAIVGFNALSACEEKLMDYLSKNYECHFFWDYDEYYTKNPNQEAGLFVRQNMEHDGWKSEYQPESTLKNISSINTVATNTNIAQCKYVAQLLRDIAANEKLDKQTAIILTDENMLLPLLYALPEEVGKVNVTMGYPLRNTPAYSLVERLMALQNHARLDKEGITFYHIDVEGILTHPYLSEYEPDTIAAIRKEIMTHRLINVPQSLLTTTPLLATLFTKAEQGLGIMTYLQNAIAAVAGISHKGTGAKLRTEYLAQLSENILKLANMVTECEIDISDKICYSLLRRFLQSIKIPFNGEPLDGIQIMGILETRNLDFRNVIILSMTDDNFPGNHTADSSFIPYNLRYAYGLPTPEHHEGVYAYYFYRLIQRAEKVYMCYCAKADDKSTGEPSRYIRQLQYESGLPIKHIKVGASVGTPHNEPIEKAKDDAVMQQLSLYLTGEKTLSPTAFSRYVQCPMKFYFASIAKIRVKDELSDEIDNLTFGNIFHKAAETLYKEVIREDDPIGILKQKMERGEFEKAVDRAIAEIYYGNEDATMSDSDAELTVIRKIILQYLKKNLLQYEAKHSDFTIKAVEEVINYNFPFKIGEHKVNMHFEGKADRIDTLDDGRLRVVDYKTGGEHLSFGGVEKLFFGEYKDRNTNMINTLLYTIILHHINDEREVVPSLYYVRTMGNKDYSPLLTNTETNTAVTSSTIKEDFEKAVSDILSELYNRNIPFRQCKDVKTCEYCDYKKICLK